MPVRLDVRSKLAVPAAAGVAAVASLVLLLLVGGAQRRAIGASDSKRAAARLASAYARLPLAFEANIGESNHRVRFLAHAAGSTVFFTSRAVALTLPGKGASHRSTLSLQFPGAGTPVLHARARLQGRVNYLIGRNRSRWHLGVPTYRRVDYAGLWPGVDAVFYGERSRLEYDLHIAPGADPRRIALRFVGARRQRIDSHGNLLLTLGGGRQVRESSPIAYQLVDGRRRAVPSRYVVSSGITRLALGGYDRTRALIVDPELVYSTYLGGQGEDVGYGIAIDPAGNAYVTGATTSANYPVSEGASHPESAGGQDAFVTKLNSNGSALLYSTYLGGTGNDIGSAIAVDPSGNAYVTGITLSADFPTEKPEQAACADETEGGKRPPCTLGDAFVTKLNPSGAITYSTYLGGEKQDWARGIAVGPGGDAYVAGITNSAKLPTTEGAFQAKQPGGYDGFVVRLNSTGSERVYATYLGGSNLDFIEGIAVDSGGNAYVTGGTASEDFPATNPPAKGSGDAFVTKLSPAGNALPYSSYLGGSGVDVGYGIATDGSGNAYVTGLTRSADFPTENAEQPGCADEVVGGKHCSLGDAFVTKVNTNSGALVYSTYVGGSREDRGNSIAVDQSGAAYVAGRTRSSTDFPLQNPVQRAPGGGVDAFAMKLSPTGGGPVYSTYLGDVGTDVAYGIAVDSIGNAFVAGFTGSPNFPVSAGAVQSSCGDELCLVGDAFVTKLPFDSTPPTSTASIPSCHGPVTVTITDDVGGAGARSVHYRIDGGAEQRSEAVGSPGIAVIAIPEGNHVLELWGEDRAGNVEPTHHVAAVQVDTRPPSISITSDQNALGYEVGEAASATVAASDATSGLAVDPTASQIPLSTERPGRFTLVRSATDRCGNSATASFTYTVVLQPKLAITVEVEPVAGSVRVGKGSALVPLTEPRLIPVGSTVDTSHGTVRLTTATAASGQFQSGEFSAGVFTVLQRRSQRGLTELRLIDSPAARVCAAAGKASTARRHLSQRVRALLRGDAHGQFTTHGAYAAATVRGTSWSIADRCDGTLTSVTRGTVVIRDFRLQRSIIVSAGKSYLARAR
jgi:hypothetical protein